MNFQPYKRQRTNKTNETGLVWNEPVVTSREDFHQHQYQNARRRQTIDALLGVGMLVVFFAAVVLGYWVAFKISLWLWPL